MTQLLHIVNKSAGDSRSLSESMPFVSEQDALLFIENGVYNALNNHVNHQQLNQLSTKTTIFVLEPDILARGINKTQLVDGVKLINYADFVDLAIEYKVIRNWL